MGSGRARHAVGLALVAALVLLASACGGGGDENGGDGGAAGSSDLRVALVTDIGSLAPDSPTRMQVLFDDDAGAVK